MRSAKLPLRSLLLVAALVVVSATAQAGWLSSLGKLAAESGEAGAHAGKLGSGAAKLGAGLHALEDAAGFVAKLPPVSKGAALAAHASPEGHWTFVTKQGETFTAANADEMGRLQSALLPGVPADGKLALYISEESAFTQAESFKSLPANAELHMVVGRDSYALVQGAVGTPQLRAAVRPNLMVELSDARTFEEAVFLLGRPLNKANVRMLSMEPGGPKQLASVPAFDKADKTTLVDRLDPSVVMDAFGKVRGQTVLITGQIYGDALHVVGSGLASDALSVSKLRAAAEAADVNLVVLQQATPRQPGGRNWLWQKVEVGGLKDALKQPTYADFFNTLAETRGPLSVTAVPDGYGRTLVQVAPPSTPGSSALEGAGSLAGDVADELSGNISIHAVSAFVRDKDSETERDARIIPGIPSWIQITAIMNFCIGLVAYYIAWPWWSKIWPPEARSEYGTAIGYQLARVVRVLAYLFVFLPIFGGLAFLWAMMLSAWEGLKAPARWWRTVRGWFTARSSA